MDPICLKTDQVRKWKIGFGPDRSCNAVLCPGRIRQIYPARIGILPSGPDWYIIIRPGSVYFYTVRIGLLLSGPDLEHLIRAGMGCLKQPWLPIPYANRNRLSDSTLVPFIIYGPYRIFILISILNDIKKRRKLTTVKHILNLLFFYW